MAYTVNATQKKTPVVTGAANAPNSSLGKGTANYATADAAGKQAIVTNQAQIKSDDAYRQSEIARTLATITNRQNAGLDTSAQQKYLTVNLGYQAPMAQAASNVQATPAASPVGNYAVPSSRTEATLDSINQFINNQSQYKFTGPESPFSYDPSTDPAYQAQLAEAQKQVANQQANTNAGLRATGQGKSSWSETVANQLGNSAMESIANNLVPTLMQQAYQRYTDDANRNLQVQSLNYGVGQDAISNLGNLYGLQDKEYFQNPITEGQLTGTYLPTAAKDALNQLYNLKDLASEKGVTAEDRTALSKRADFIRTQLQAMGIDTSNLGADVSAAQARSTPVGIRTLGGQQQDLAAQSQALAERQANLNAALNVSDITGRVVTPQTDWNGLFRQAASGNAPLTQSAQQQAVVNNQWEKSFAYQQARDAVADTQWQKTFDENVRQYGLNYALDQLVTNHQIEASDRDYWLSVDANNRAWAESDYAMSQGANGGDYNGLSQKDVISTIMNQFAVEVPVYDEYGDQTGTKSQYPNKKDDATKKAIYEAVTAYGLPDNQEYQAMLALGLSAADIKNLDSQYTSSAATGGGGGPKPNTAQQASFKPGSGGLTFTNGTSGYNNYYKARQFVGKKSFNSSGSVIAQAIKDGGYDAAWLAPTLELVARESAFDPTAANPKSSAKGLFQFLDGTRRDYGGKKVDWSDPYQQAVAGLKYIKNRYGTPTKALQFWDKNNYY